MDSKVTVESSDEPKPGKPISIVKRRQPERFPWQRLTLTAIGLLVIVVIWQWATWHLYSLPDTSITAFTSITNNCFYVIGALVVFFVTGRLVYEWKNTTVAEVIQHGENIVSRHHETSEHIEHVIVEGEPGSPAVRPFSASAVEEE